ncbi:MAG: AAA family ATPase, partial [Cetobacterium sp.]
NNYGKTYLAYSLYGIYTLLNECGFSFEKAEIEELREKREVVIFIKDIKNRLKKISKKISKEFEAGLDVFFNFDKSFFVNTKFEINISEKDMKIGGVQSTRLVRKIENNTVSQVLIEIIDTSKISIKIIDENMDSNNYFIIEILEERLSSLLFPAPFILPSVREGLNMFKNELNLNRNVLIDTLMSHKKNMKINPFSIMEDLVSRYARPISEYIEFINGLEGSLREKGPFANYANDLGKIVQGSYSYENNQIYFKPHRSNGLKLPLHMVSSTVRSLAGLYLYLRYSENPQRIIIDEPELNLHPENQRKIARFLAQLSNKGLEIIITTHSSYILQELNTLILFKNNFEEKEALMSKYKYSEEEFLDSNMVSSYLIDKGNIKKMEINNKGIIMTTFNQVIDSLNTLTDTLLFEVEESELVNEPTKGDSNI